jgi:G:T/U-mismatch repair DNA glycosylase
MKIEREIHPYNLQEMIPIETRALVVGTAPPPRFSYPRYVDSLRPNDVDFYYGSEANYMWEFLDNIAKDLDGYELFENASSAQCRDAMRDFLRRHRIWMRDVLQVYQRKTGKKESANDADIIQLQFTDFSPIFTNYPCLKIVAFTSETAANWTFIALNDQKLFSFEIYLQARSEWKKIQKTLLFEGYIAEKFEEPFLRTHLGEHETEFYILPSPTGRARIKGLTKSIKEQIYKRVLFPA